MRRSLNRTTRLGLAPCRPRSPKVTLRRATGPLPASALEGLGTRPFGFYVHVPFCTVRCGYCDFNTYTSVDLGRTPTSPAPRGRRTPTRRSPRSGSPGGCSGTSTCPSTRSSSAGVRRPCCRPADLTRIVAAIGEEFGLAAGAEVTTESNPDSVDAGDLARLREGGINRVSFGMQSAVPHVLRVLDRTHDPRAGPRRSWRWAREAGFEQVSLDLIYGTPGESLDDWRTSVDAALACAPDHVSAYALIVEEGTALARQIRRGDVPMTDDDDLADKYLLADEAFERGRPAVVRGVQLGARPRPRPAGTTWATGPAATGGASGPARTRTSAASAGGTSSTPRRTPSGSPTGVSPAHGRETLDAETRRVERVLLETRLRAGPPGRRRSTPAGRAALPEQVARGLVEDGGAGSGAGGADHPRPAAGRRRRARPAHLTEADDRRVAVVLEVRHLHGGRRSSAPARRCRRTGSRTSPISRMRLKPATRK